MNKSTLCNSNRTNFKSNVCALVFRLTKRCINIRICSSYCLKCKKNTENINPRVSKIKRTKLLLNFNLKCAICGSI